MFERLVILWHFAATRWGARPHSRVEMLARQQKKLRCFLREVSRLSGFYRGLPPELAAFPVLTKADFLRHFPALNRHGINLEEATGVALRAEREREFQPQLPGGITVGLSSGTSGERHVFLVGRGDRSRWAGQMLARMLSGRSLRRLLNPFAPPLRIAFFLRANSNLYQTISSRRIRFDYYDLTRPFETLMNELSARTPDILVAPATVLAELSGWSERIGIRPTQVISVAEVLDDRERERIEAAFGVRVEQIYQAAEGFLGSTCAAGQIHLNEEGLHIEQQWIDEKRFHPVITDFSRGTQWFVRHRLDDILRVREGGCPCGRASLTVDTIEGRVGEILWARNPAGNLVPVFPDTLRQALYALPATIGLYRIEQHGDRWDVRLRDDNPDLEKSVFAALEKMFARLALVPPGIRFLPWTDQPPSEKQKRIRCVTRPQ